MKLIAALQRESPLTLAREALWRSQRRWRQMNFQGQMRATVCPVRYRPAGYYQVRLSECTDRSSRAILNYANAICDGRFPWFAYGPVQLGFPPRWNFDFVSGKDWPEAKSDTIQIVRHDGSDVKVPWELSRLQFLPVLAKAWLVSGEIRYSQAGRELLYDWMEKNPVGVGVNWTMPMEAALRAISICLFLELLGSGEDEAGDPWHGKVVQSLWQHLRFIEAYNEFSHLARSNHYLSNILGLFCLSSYLQGSGMEKKRRLYKRLLEQEMLLQVYEDGGDYEASSGYHLLNLQMFSSALRLMDAQKMEPDPEFVGRLVKMYRFLAALADQRGQVPHIGDCDDGRIELLVDDLEQTLAIEGRHSLTVSSLLGVGESLLGEHYGGQNEEAAWYVPLPNSRGRKPSEVVGHSPVIFPISGVAVATSGLAQVVFLAMPNGINGKGSHTHNDKLSIIVRLAGEELFRDPGTGWYTRDGELRNRFRSTAAHNTVRVDGEEQNRFSPSPGALFHIFDDAQVTPIEVQDTDGRVLRASHHGYDRLGVVHTRSVRLGPQSTLALEDHLTASGSHTFEACFHLQREWQVDIHQGSGTEVRCHLQGTRVAADLCCQAPVELEMLCLQGEVSNSYGATEEAKRIVVRGSFRASIRLLSCISWQA